MELTGNRYTHRLCLFTDLFDIVKVLSTIIACWRATSAGDIGHRDIHICIMLLSGTRFNGIERTRCVVVIAIVGRFETMLPGYWLTCTRYTNCL